MHAGSPAPRPKARTPYRVRLKPDAIRKIEEKHGLVTIQQKAAFFGIADTTWGRLQRGLIDPGEETIAAVLGSHPDDPDITFDNLFEVV